MPTNQEDSIDGQMDACPSLLSKESSHGLKKIFCFHFVRWSWLNHLNEHLTSLSRNSPPYGVLSKQIVPFTQNSECLDHLWNASTCIF